MIKWPLRKIIEIEWLDSNGQSRWAALSEYKKHTVADCKTIGYLLTQNKKEVVLMFTQSPCNDGDGNGAMAIPRGCITKIKRLK